MSLAEMLDGAPTVENSLAGPQNVNPAILLPGLIPGQGTRFHLLQLKIPCAATKTWHSQINKYI